MCSMITRVYNMYSLKDLNIRQSRWLELLKDYDMSVFYHPEKANVVADALRRVSIGVWLMWLMIRKNW